MSRQKLKFIILVTSFIRLSAYIGERVQKLVYVSVLTLWMTPNRICVQNKKTSHNLENSPP